MTTLTAADLLRPPAIPAPVRMAEVLEALARSVEEGEALDLVAVQMRNLARDLAAI